MRATVLNVGQVQACLEEGGLRGITYNGVEIVRGVYMAVRDHDWGTVAPRFQAVHIDENAEGVTVTINCEHIDRLIAFEWKGSIRIESRLIRFDFEGRARSS